MNRLETIKAAIEWARKNPQAYAEFVERRKREAEEDAAIEAEARAEEWREMQEAKEAADRAAKGPSISISSEGGNASGQAPQPPPPPSAEPTETEPPQDGEKKPVEGGADAGAGNDAPKPPDAAEGAESRSDGEGSETEGEDSMWTYTDEEGNKHTIPAPEIEEVDGEVEVVPFPD